MTVSVKSAPSVNDAVFVERLGTIVRGKWKLESLLGVGGMAAVYGATREDSGERAALKILHASFAHDKDACERFLREAVVADKVSHPAAVRILENDTTDEGEPFLLMELLEGDTVLDAWRKVGRQMAIIPALQIAERVIDCLAVCHEAGVIHRDLKPANLFITNASEVKVLDFGVAQMRDESEPVRAIARSAMGTPAYMSPEQAMGRDVDGRTDLFSVGAILHALITGHRIHAAKTEAESLVLAASHPVPSVKTIAPNLPPEVTRLVDRALAWDRQSRFADAEQMQEAALEALASQGGEPLGDKGGKSRGLVFDLGGAPTRAPLSLSFGDRHPPSGRNAPMRAFFRNVDIALASARTSGFEHEQTASALRNAIDAFSAGTSSLHDLEDADSSSLTASARELTSRVFRVDVLPYGFVSEGQLVWEPSASMVPHRLFESGVRNLVFGKGLTVDELREFLIIATKEPGKDLPPDDDLRSALWERALSHVTVIAQTKLATGVLADRDRFHAQATVVRERVTGAVGDRADALDAGSLDPMPGLFLDEETRSAASRELALGTEEWTLRYLDAASFGYAQAASERELSLLLGSLHKSAQSLLWSKRLVTVIGVYHGMSVRLSEISQGDKRASLLRGLADALFGGDNFTLVARLAGTSVVLGKLLEPPLALLGISLTAALTKDDALVAAPASASAALASPPAATDDDPPVPVAAPATDAPSESSPPPASLESTP